MLFGKKLLSKLLEDKNLLEFGKLKPDWFQEGELNTYLRIVKYVDRYGELPELSYIKGDKIKEPYNFLKDSLINEYISGKLSDTVTHRINKLIKEGSASEVLNELQRFVMEHSVESGKDIYSLKDLGDMAYDFVQTSKYKNGMTGIPTGWPSLDRITGGHQRGDIDIILARPKSGKTQLLFYSAMMCKKLGYNPFIISMEMKALQSARRIMAMEANLPMSFMKKGQLSIWGERKLKEKLKGLCDKPFFMEGQFKKDISEIAGLVYSLKELDIVFIDGGYLIKLMKSSRNENRWEKVSEIVETLKTVAVKANINITVTFQFNRSVKKTDINKAGLEHVQLSDSIGQIASVALGIFDDEAMVGRKRVEVIDDRESEGGGFFINWDWESMNFSEIEERNEDEPREHY